MSLAGCCVFFILWLIFRKHNEHKQEEALKNKKNIFYMEVVLFFLATFYFSGRIIYSALPYNGALSWKIDEWMRKRDVELQHNNIFKDGAAGILSDLDGAVGLPGELYIANKCQITFDQDGLIQTIYTFLYGRDKSGETRTYLVDYDAKKGRNMKVWIDGEANADYDENMRLAPMLRILERADYEQKVRTWSKGGDSKVYEILYLGRRSFQTAEGLTYIPGDADGDGIDRGAHNFEMLRAGGEIVGYEVSLHIPESEEMIPVRYMMEPEYISQDELNQAADREHTEEAKDAEGWTVDESDGSMYFFLDDGKGWRLSVADAAAGSRFYVLERTEDGGTAWERVNDDPFEGTIGVAEGLVFFDENFGFAGLAGASQSHSQLYVTRDGGKTFEEVQLPMDTVTRLPEHAAEYGLTLEDYDYCCMPKEEDGVLTIEVMSEAGENEGILFRSQDDGMTWEFLEAL